MLARKVVVSSCVVAIGIAVGAGCAGGGPRDERVDGVSAALDPSDAALACGDVDLEATRFYARPTRWDDGVASFARAFPFVVPSEVAVTAGNSGNHVTKLTLAHAGASVTCFFRGP